ncbi:hypothetical protein SSS_01115 [Sarcoptes scabiei]|nr:hypothetical protein SSS_01115 [Sarcoptes scabiei]UXI19107.1 vacuolar protein sorting-associated protein 52 [Sarcoptes scabiei]
MNNFPVSKMSDFGPKSTADDVLEHFDIESKVAIVTGSNCGIGFEIARALALKKVHVIMGCRNHFKAMEAIKKIQAIEPNARLTFIECDLADLNNVKVFCSKFISMNIPLDILIMNAGLTSIPYSLTVDGYETVFQVNYLSQFYMVRMLEKKLIQSHSRVVIVASESHRFSTLRRSNIHRDWNPRRYISFMAYNDSKLCNILFAKYLQKRLIDSHVSVVSCHPGNFVQTEIKRYWWLLRILYFLVKPFTKTANQGAATVVYCAIAENSKEIGGKYFINCKECEPSNASKDMELAEILWELSSDMIETLDRSQSIDSSH